MVNFGNMHDYFGTFNPETGPWGGAFYSCGGYGGVPFDKCLAQMVAVGEPVISTETGYASGQGLSDAIIGRYELRTLFNSLRVGISRTYLYEMIDDPGLNHGLLTDSFTPRPDYTAIKNVMSLSTMSVFPSHKQAQLHHSRPDAERISTSAAEKQWHLLPCDLAGCAKCRRARSVDGLQHRSTKRDPHHKHTNRWSNNLCS